MAAPAIDDDSLPTSYKDAMANVKMPSRIDERLVLMPGTEMPESWSSKDELEKMDGEQTRSCVRHVMTSCRVLSPAQPDEWARTSPYLI